jgi:uncharacterized membrane protein
MKSSSEIREIARNVLKGNWAMAVLVGFVAHLLGGTESNTAEVKLNIEEGNANLNLNFGGETLYSTGGSLDSDIGMLLATGAAYIASAAIILAIIFFLVGSIVEIGYAKVNLNLQYHQAPSFDTLFAYLPYWKTAIASSLLRTLYITLWTLLLVIPGVVASYSYAMTSYILAENPELTASEAIEKSKQIMDGYKMDLFCLHLSFIGWDILCLLTLGIGNLWLRPYKEASIAAFYKEITSPKEDLLMQPVMDEI